MPTTVLIPGSNSTSLISFNIDTSLVLVGANGAGKSRMGARIEEAQANKVHRISAHKILSISENLQLMPEDKARKLLNIGSEHAQPYQVATTDQLMQQRNLHRWNNDFGIGRPLDDFNVVISLLFASMRRRNALYVDKIKTYEEGGRIGERPELTEDASDVLLRIWKELLPSVNISLTDDKIRASSGSATYSGSKMSDGERVIFYLCAQTLIAAESSVLIVDEPELHVHRALLSRLWDLLEQARPDCQFIYLTQDLEFASTRENSKTIWVRSFSGSVWDWQEIPPSDAFPRQLMLEVLGTRKAIRLIEGTPGSLDAAIYTILFPCERIKPVGGCDDVSMLVRAANSDPLLETKDISGIVDRDFRSDEKIAYLRSKKIAVLEVAEVENLYCVPEILSFLCTQEYHTEPEASAAENSALKTIQSAFDAALADQAARHALQQIRDKMATFSTSQRPIDASAMRSEVNSFVTGLDVEAIFQASLDLYNSAAQSGNPKEMLKLLNRKGLYRQIASSIGLSQDLYLHKVQSYLRKDESLRTAVAAYVG